jgi:hypothetical protein
MIATTIINSTRVNPSFDDFMISTQVGSVRVAHAFPCAVQTQCGKRHARPLDAFPFGTTHHMNAQRYMEIETIFGTTV